jgi:hypothetical protein
VDFRVSSDHGEVVAFLNFRIEYIFVKTFMFQDLILCLEVICIYVSIVQFIGIDNGLGLELGLHPKCEPDITYQHRPFNFLRS